MTVRVMRVRLVDSQPISRSFAAREGACPLHRRTLLRTVGLVTCLSFVGNLAASEGEAAGLLDAGLDLLRLVRPCCTEAGHDGT
jgi:hypothetical protein